MEILSDDIVVGTPSEIMRLRFVELEGVIKAGKKAFIEVGAALTEIRDSKLYKQDFKSFEEYCRKRWGWTKQHAHRLIVCAPIAKSNPKVTSINQCRELAKVPKERQTAVFQTAVNNAAENGRRVTAKDIAKAAKPDLVVMVESTPRTQTPIKVMVETLPRTQDPVPVSVVVETPEDGDRILEEAAECDRTVRNLSRRFRRATPEERGEFLSEVTFDRDNSVVMVDKEGFKKRFDLWFEHAVLEVA